MVEGRSRRANALARTRDGTRRIYRCPKPCLADRTFATVKRSKLEKQRWRVSLSNSSHDERQPHSQRALLAGALPRRSPSREMRPGRQADRTQSSRASHRGRARAALPLRRNACSSTRAQPQSPKACTAPPPSPPPSWAACSWPYDRWTAEQPEEETEMSLLTPGGDQAV